MVDEKDLEIARLRGQLEAEAAQRAAQAQRDGPVTGTFRVLGALLLAAGAGVALLLIVAAALPDPPTLEEKQADCKARYGEEPSYALNQCLMKNLAEELADR